MKEFEGIKLEQRKPFAECGLIFWQGDEPSQSLEFDTEEKCDTVLRKAINGEGILVKYDFNNKELTVFPHRIIKVKFVEEYIIPDKAMAELSKGELTDDVQFPRTDLPVRVGNNVYQPFLVDDIEEAQALNIMRQLDKKEEQIG